MIRPRLPIIAVAGLTTLVCLGLGYFLRDGYRRAEHAAEVSVRNAAATLEARIDGMLHHVEFLLEDIADDLPSESLSARAAPRYAAKINASLAEHRAHAPEVIAIRIIGANGDELYRSQAEPLPNVAGRDYFKSLSANPRAKVHFSEVFTGAVVRAPLMVVSKPIADHKGHLRAIVTIALDLAHLQKLFAAVDFDKRGLIGLRRIEDGRLVVRWPDAPEAVNQPVRTPIEDRIREGKREGVERYVARTDGIERLFAFRTIGDYPFRIGAAVAVDDYLADWRRTAAVSIAVAVLMLAVFGLMAWRIDAELRRRKASEERFRALTSLSSDWYWEQDADFRLTLMSSDMVERTGFVTADYFGKKRWDLPALNLSEEDWGRHRAQLERHEPFRDFEMRRPDRDGQPFWVSVSGEPVFDDDGHFTGYRGVGHNITEQKLAEDLLERRVAERTAELQAVNRQLESFSYSVSHDLRAPLRAITGFIEVFLESAAPVLTEQQRGLLDRVSKNAEKMNVLIEELLTFSRMTRVSIEVTPFPLRGLVDEVVQELRPAYPRATVQVGELPVIKADRAMLRQVFVNLIGNALKFSRGTEQPQVAIGCTGTGKARDYFVRDNGAGFDMLYADKLFGVFQRLHRSEDFEGTGVGLAIVRQIIERHGGRVWAHSAPGEGATFSFTLG